MKSPKLPVSLPHDLYQKLQSLASANGISMAAQVRYLISQASNPQGTTGGSTGSQNINDLDAFPLS
jgi:hypothetical protein